MTGQEKIRQDFEKWWAYQVERTKKTADAILRERMEAWIVKHNLTADIELTIDWSIDMRVSKLEPVAGWEAGAA